MTDKELKEEFERLHREIEKTYDGTWIFILALMFLFQRLRVLNNKHRRREKNE